MRISVVIPTYNSASLVVEAIRSVLAQTVSAHEVIVVDDGSDDDTASRMAEFGSSIRYIKKPNGGVSSARNRGIAEATGDLIGFLDADDVWHPRKLEIQLAILSDRPDIGLLGTGVYSWPASSHPGVSAILPVVKVSFEQLLTKNRLGTSTVLIRSSIFQTVGNFDQSLQGPEDYDMWLRIARCAAVYILPTSLVGYRGAVPNSLSKNAVRMESGLRRIMAKLISDGTFRKSPFLRRKSWSYVYCSCGLMYRDSGQLTKALNLFVRSIFSWPFRAGPGEIGAVDRLRLLRATLVMCFLTRKRKKV